MVEPVTMYIVCCQTTNSILMLNVVLHQFGLQACDKSILSCIMHAVIILCQSDEVLDHCNS
jgi:hypothetical protein